MYYSILSCIILATIIYLLITLVFSFKSYGDIDGASTAKLNVNAVLLAVLLAIYITFQMYK